MYTILDYNMSSCIIIVYVIPQHLIRRYAILQHVII